ncbi:MAG: leucine-rich repeat domain-containing protein [Planctomycetes bacterium]|nr:leucine-rich repeat domain-containing protein [Planctomycetota bacterium]
MQTQIRQITTLMLVSLVCAATALAEGIFPDKALESAVRQYVFEKRNNKEPLNEKDVETISTIKFKGYTFTLDGKRVEREMKIKDLTGLEKCRSLASLDLEGHQITNVAALKDLKLIQFLDLGNNQIKDAKPLEGLTKLQYLKLSGNQISDLAPLAKMENMRSLYLADNQIKDVKPIESLKKTWSLYLGGNQVTDLKPLAALKSLKTLDVRGNGVSDIAPLAGLTEWDYLFLDDNKIEDLGVLVEMAKKDREGKNQFALFWKVYLDGNPLSEEAKTKQIAELKKHSLPNRIHFQ